MSAEILLHPSVLHMREHEREWVIRLIEGRVGMRCMAERGRCVFRRMRPKVRRAQ
jgi:hypothetical protein